MKEEFPLSELAQIEINESKANILSGLLVMLIILSGALIGINWRIGVGMVLLTIFYGVGKVCIYKKKKKKILEKNKEDYLMAEKIAKALSTLCSMSLDPSFENSGEFLGDDWKPFRVEYYLSESLRGELEGLFQGTWFGLFGGRVTGTLKGIEKANIIPKLLETSCLLFLKKEKGRKTLRVIIPSEDVVREMIAQYLERWALLFPCLEWKETKFGSHTYLLLNAFARGECKDEFIPLLKSLSAPEIVDALAASCEKPLNERLNVCVYGLKIKEGVALGVRIGLEKENLKTVFPNRLFRKIDYALRSISQKKLPFIPFSEEK